MNLAEAMRGRGNELADGRTLLRSLYADRRMLRQEWELLPKQDRKEAEEDYQQLINETLDDIDTLERAFKTLFIEAEAEINEVRLSEARISQQVESAAQRLRERAIA